MKLTEFKLIGNLLDGPRNDLRWHKSCKENPNLPYILLKNDDPKGYK